MGRCIIYMFTLIHILNFILVFFLYCKTIKFEHLDTVFFMFCIGKYEWLLFTVYYFPHLIILCFHRFLSGAYLVNIVFIYCKVRNKRVVKLSKLSTIDTMFFMLIREV